MIRLAGHRPDEDIQIEIVGTRPGERLHEYAARRRRDRSSRRGTRRSAASRRRCPTDPTRLSYFRRRVAAELRGRARPGRGRAARPDAGRVRRRVPSRRRPPGRAGSRHPAPRAARRCRRRRPRPGLDRTRRVEPPASATRNLPALLGGDRDVRSGPAVRPSDAARRSSASSAASNRRTTGACSPTARS